MEDILKFCSVFIVDIVDIDISHKHEYTVTLMSVNFVDLLTIVIY